MDVQRTLWAGLMAGVLAGLLLGILQVTTVTPLIHRAEVYEIGIKEDHSHEHHEHEEAWKEATRTFCGTTALGMAFGILTSLLLRILPQQGFRMKWTFGLLFGVCGFLAFHGIPALGLPPPPPGIVGAEQDLGSRQAWWLLTVGTSALAFLVLAFAPSFLKARHAVMPRTSWVVALGAAGGLFLLPFLLGVPQHSTVSVVPEGLRMKFLLTSLGTNALFWLVLGTLCTALLAHEAQTDDGAGAHDAKA